MPKDQASGEGHRRAATAVRPGRDTSRAAARREKIGRDRAVKPSRDSQEIERIDRTRAWSRRDTDESRGFGFLHPPIDLLQRLSNLLSPAFVRGYFQLPF